MVTEVRNFPGSHHDHRSTITLGYRRDIHAHFIRDYLRQRGYGEVDLAAPFIQECLRSDNSPSPAAPRATGILAGLRRMASAWDARPRSRRLATDA